MTEGLLDSNDAVFLTVATPLSVLETLLLKHLRGLCCP